MPLFTTRSRALRAWLCSAHCCMLLLTSPSTRADQLGLEAQPEAYASPTNMKQQIALTVRTSAVHGAGTASPIFVTLHGTHFSSPEMELFELDPATKALAQPLRPGSTRSRTLEVTQHIGRLTSVELRAGERTASADQGGDPWRLAQLTARTGGRTYHFPRHDAWLVRRAEHPAREGLASRYAAEQDDVNTNPADETVVLPVLRATEVKPGAGQWPL